MSALTPHIRVLRAVGESAMTMGSGESQRNAELFHELGWVLKRAADALEAEEAALQLPRAGKDEPITYHPRGKH